MTPGFEDLLAASADLVLSTKNYLHGNSDGEGPVTVARAGDLAAEASAVATTYDALVDAGYGQNPIVKGAREALDYARRALTEYPPGSP